ncbi:257R [Invertebrate iridescent virus Kaz2018]|nr:257R [Invertebrate iridescent virus Kaz2018]
MIHTPIITPICAIFFPLTYFCIFMSHPKTSTNNFSIFVFDSSTNSF